MRRRRDRSHSRGHAVLNVQSPLKLTPICPATADHPRYSRAPGRVVLDSAVAYPLPRYLPRRAVNTRIWPTVFGGTHGTRCPAVTH